MIPHVGTKLRIPEVLLVEKLRTQQRFNVSTGSDLAACTLYQPPRAEVVPGQDALVDQARKAVLAVTTPKIFPNMLISLTGFCRYFCYRCWQTF